mmetsp:Transcript_12196/g.35604  ORF Transcript_12196/g.35604 Transcript_12196/m.35604 type:complete len:119 (-) Transcript_12196:3-359(-)
MICCTARCVSQAGKLFKLLDQDDSNDAVFTGLAVGSMCLVAPLAVIRVVQALHNTQEKSNTSAGKVKLPVLTFYKADSSDNVTRLRRDCPPVLCGPGVSMVMRLLTRTCPARSVFGRN